jgi:hypothetical protein
MVSLAVSLAVERSRKSNGLGRMQLFPAVTAWFVEEVA